MQNFLSYIFWPNPPAPDYTNTKVEVLLLICVVFLIVSVALRFWRKGLHNPVTRRLSASWPTASLWFGLTGLFMTVCRVEGIAFLAMRFWWVIWGLSLLGYLFVQLKLFRARHYEIIPQERSVDPRAKYLPTKKHR